MINRNIGKVAMSVLALIACSTHLIAAVTDAQVESILAKRTINAVDIAVLKGYAHAVADRYPAMKLDTAYLDANLSAIRKEYGLVRRSKKKVKGRPGSVEIKASLKKLRTNFEQADKKNGNTRLADVMRDAS